MTPIPEQRARAILGTRMGAGLFDMSHRGLLEVRGEDRVRWLDGMISGDVRALEDAGSGSGCYATLLTHRGAIVADLHVARMGPAYLLETLRSEIPRIREILEKFIVADDVTLSDRSDEYAALGLEGPSATQILSLAIRGSAALPKPECWAEATIGDCGVLAAAFGFSGEPGYQLRVAEGEQALLEAAIAGAAETVLAGDGELVRGDAESLEVLRVEAGIPALGAELDEEVLPPEARLERAIATDKGCYVGQEIIARLRARGQVNHLLVGLRLDRADDGGLPAVGVALSATGRETGEITSIAESPSEGAVALGYVRREHAESGTRIEFDGGSAIVTELPFVALSDPSVGGTA
ncbi:MAG: hypothetical protein CL908_07670 [Deltaproteobacteria bacterium]|nr:hypothetical protein [Deltaproteobacteria bacterium]